MNLQAIFQVKIDGRGWMDYCREQPDNVEHAERMLDQLINREGGEFRVYVEDWDNELDRLPFDDVSPAPQYPRSAVHVAPTAAFFDHWNGDYSTAADQPVLGFRDQLKRDMQAYRLGVAPLPQAFTDMHRRAADVSVDELARRVGNDVAAKVIAREIVSAGWCDGFTVLRVVIEDNPCQFRAFRWSDANGGSWFEESSCGSQVLFWIPDDRPGHI